MASDELPRFSLFRDLPAELRLLIWKEALAIDCVWAAVLAERETEHLDGTRRIVREARFRMHFVGPSPHWVGQACHEARETMKLVFGPPFRGPRGPKLIVGDKTRSDKEDRYYWINPAATVLVLHSPRHSTRLLRGFARDELARIEHLAVFWAHWATIAAFNMRLRQECPGLRTLIIEKGRLRYQKCADHIRYPPLDAETASIYMRLSHPDAPVDDDQDLRSQEFRERTFVWKEDMPVKPRVHLLTDRGSMANSPIPKQSKSL
ncbi:hypothetical protein PGQ11_005936 [Apiospora arundinis]|uniref:2EXR domain-containing protein n=1 Tax=Apiospora arundinis TaxID=335852 RepID=A0ABR2IR26_9PEZI